MEWDKSFLQYKIINSLEKVLPSQTPSETGLAKSVFKNERLNFQIALKNTFPQALSGFKIKAKGGLAEFIAIRKVDFVPVGYTIPENIVDDYYIDNAPGLFPDVLREIDSFGIVLPCGQWRSVWISIYAEQGLPVGSFDTCFEIFSHQGEKVGEVIYSLEVLDADLPQIEIPITNWIHYDCIASKHGVKLFSKKFYRVFAEYLKAYVDAENNMLLVPIFTPPLDTKVGVERRTAQLIKVEVVNGGYQFDFTELENFIRFALQHGIKYFELSHLFTQWGGEYCPKIIAKTVEGEKQIFGWDTSSHGEAYKDFLRSLLPLLCQTLERLGVRDKTFVHLTDEPRLKHVESYRQCYEFVKPYIGNMPILDALSDYEFYQQGLIDCPVPKTCAYDNVFAKQGITGTFVYYCWYPSDNYYSNRFINMPSQRTRILGIQLYANKSKGFLHWGFNFYNSKLSVMEIDPYATTDGAGFFPSGDAFIVYPKRDGVVYSLRLELMKECFQDYKALKLLECLVGQESVNKILDEFGVKGFHEYPRSTQAHLAFREYVNERIIQAKSYKKKLD